MTSPQAEWNGKSREELRESLRRHVLGETRLARDDHDAILQACREIYLEDVCPESEWNTFLEYAAAELVTSEFKLAEEMASWPAVTDCDRLDLAELALRKRGILLWQASPCCDTCTRAELRDRIDVIHQRDPGFRDRARGYAFFIDQSLPDRLAENTELSLYLGYGWFSADRTEVADEVYRMKALEIGREVCDCLRHEGLAVDWNNRLDNKIRVSLNWLRRQKLD